MTEAEKGAEGVVVADREEGEVTPSKEGGEKAPGPLTKHPLENRWTLWFDNPQQKGKGGWGSSLKSIYTFGTVEDFWCLFNNIVPPSRLAQRADMHLFKDGIRPEWEDPRCERGGSWTIPCARGKEFLDRVWLNTILALIGEQLEEGQDVCGVVVNIRPQKDRVALWTSSADKESVQMSIGKQLKDILDISDKLAFQSFKDQKGRGAQDKYTV